MRAHKSDGGLNRIVRAASSLLRQQIGQKMPMKEIHISQKEATETVV
jgi:hypothetical protein